MILLQRFALLILTLCLSACLQAENSNSQDAELYGDSGGGTPEFLAAKAILQTNCVSCHAEYTKSEAELKAIGWIVGGDPENSKTYYRLVGSAGALGPKNMPQSGTLSSTDVETIAVWIDSVSP